MQSLEHTPEPDEAGRIVAIDVARAVALLGMAAYHLTWDLAHFGFIAPSVPFTPVMRARFAYGRGRVPGAGRRVVRAGASDGLRRDGVRPPPDDGRLRRFPGDGGDGVSRAGGADHLRHPPLHRRREPAGGGFRRRADLDGARCRRGGDRRALGRLAAIGSTRPALVWLGLGTVAPPTLDWRPLLPWSGVVLVALSLDARFSAAPRRRAMGALAPSRDRGPRHGLRRPPQSRDLSRPPADPVRRRCSLWRT